VSAAKHRKKKTRNVRNTVAKTKGDTLLSLCIIVGKEEQVELERCLRSTQGSLFDEIIVTRTHEDTQVEAVAKKYAARTPFFKWVDDFSAARNYCYDQAKGKYIMWLDADDELSVEAYRKLQDLKSSVLEKCQVHYVLMNYNYSWSGDKVLLTLPRERITLNDPVYRWCDPIHEYLPIYSNVPHLERFDISVEHRRIKTTHTDRNLRILEKLYGSGKASPRNIFYYVKDLFDSGEREKSIKALKEYLNGPNDYYQNRIQAHIRFARYLKEKQDLGAARETLLKALTISEEYAEVYVLLADIEVHLSKDKNKAIQYLEKALTKKADGLFAADPSYYNKKPLEKLMFLYDETNNVERALLCAQKFLEISPGSAAYVGNVNYLQEKLRKAKETPQGKTGPLSQYRIGFFEEVIVPEYPSQRIRRLNLLLEMKKRGYAADVHSNYHRVPVDTVVAKAKDTLDIAIFSSYSPVDMELVKKLQEQGILVLFDFNEGVIGITNVAEMLSLADGVVCCSKELAKMAKPYAKKVTVIEDAYEPLEGEPYNYLQGQEKLKALFIGMGGNSYLVTEYLKDTITEAGYELEVCTEWENATVPWSLEGWQDVMKSAHVVLCPQRVKEQPAKSNIKAAQAMALGIPVIASKLPAYLDFIKHKENGYLCDNPEDWYAALVELKDVYKRIQIGMNGKDSVQGYSIEAIADKWDKVLTSWEPREVITPKAVEEGPKPAIPIIVPVYNEVPYLKECVKSIRANTDHPYHIILSDAGSGEETWQYLDSLEGVTVLGKRGERKNFSQAVNAGVNMSGAGKYFVVLNSDVIVSKGWLDNLAAKMDREDRLAACGVLSNCDRGWLHGTEGTPNYPMRLQKAGLELVPAMTIPQINPHLAELNEFMERSNGALHGQFREQPWVAYYATIFARSAWLEVGELDPLYKNGCEDLDHCRRLKKMNYRTGQAIDSFVFHFGGISRGAYQSEGKEEYDKEDKYNHWLYQEKWKKPRVVIFTGPAWEKWDRDTVERGMAGSETWAAELAAEFSKTGADTYVFNDCVEDGAKDKDGVTYLHYSKYFEWSQHLHVDFLLLSRSCDLYNQGKLHAGRVDVMVHDIWLNQDKNYDVKKWAVKKYGVLSEWHKEFVHRHHGIPQEQLFLTANGVRQELYAQVPILEKKNMAVYSSSPDRGLLQLLGMVPQILKEVPDFELVVAYGFENWEKAALARNNAEELARIEKLKGLLDQPGVKYVGRVSKKELAEYQKKAKVWAYPTWFTETFCISAVEAGLAQNAIVTTPLAGLLTTVGEAGIYITGPDTVNPTQWSFTKEYQEKFLAEVIKTLTDEPYRWYWAEKAHKKAVAYSWENIAKGWLQEWNLLKS
jgi:glycosyltransferase involved in cell wall biosynthesis